LPDLMAVLPKRASTLLVAGGLAYTAGMWVKLLCTCSFSQSAP
jgi:hypothetical protein